jgi:hypothetical protein
LGVLLCSVCFGAFDVPAKAGAEKARIRPRVRAETNVFILVLLLLRCRIAPVPGKHSAEPNGGCDKLT